MQRDLDNLARAAGGVVQGDNVHFGAVLSDTRTIQPGALFVALRGDRFDGHDFVPDAAAHGAAAALVSRPVQAPIPQVIVSDTLTGLSAFASAWRRYHGARSSGSPAATARPPSRKCSGRFSRVSGLAS